MNQDRMKKQSDRNRTDMEPAEGSREDTRGSGSSSEKGMGGTDSSGLRSGTNRGAGISNRERTREELGPDELSDLDESDSQR